jgi:hypothetical protein
MAGEYGFDFWWRQGVTSSQLTYRLWGQPGLISSCYLDLLPRAYRCRAVKLTTGVLSGVEDNTLSCSSVRTSWSSSTVLDTGQILYFTVTLSVGEWRCFSVCNCFHPRVTWSVQRIIENPPPHCSFVLLCKGADILTSRKLLARLKFGCRITWLRLIDPTGAHCDVAWSILQQSWLAISWKADTLQQLRVIVQSTTVRIGTFVIVIRKRNCWDHVTLRNLVL